MFFEYIQDDNKWHIEYLIVCNLILVFNQNLQKCDSNNHNKLPFVSPNFGLSQDKIKKQMDFMLKNDYLFTYTSYDLIDENSLSLNKVILAKEYEEYKSLLKGNNIGCLTVMIDRLKIKGDIRFSNNSHEDYILWLSLLMNNTRAYGLSEVLSSYRKTSTSISHNKIKAASWTWNIYRNIENLSLIKSIYYFINYAMNGIRKK